ncbi:GLUG motif-containing protein [Candidatus Bathycorpusculum sp.]|uniref:GLUG motif-containing protein n=1 Tax=Candidatus Bathycorpusculum sp. TaxID=2994959 RepID=UPI002821D3A1|nr:bacterial Ig-like domain-containing protein [Candidatus Termitimicrobium sp.]MCL2686793.1 bacterial Ig-like domain-containing protein [Candidatus Termitimicrobium sp.]
MANEWVPIGALGNAFAGIYNGDDHLIQGLYIDTTGDYQGLFGNSIGTIRNVGVIVSYINGNNRVGGIAGNNVGAVTNCYNTGTIWGVQWVGGVTGGNTGTITNCFKTGKVLGSSQVGGIVGISIDGSIANCYNTGSVTSVTVSGWDVGGIVGYSSRGSIANCYNTGAVTGNDKTVGGIAGTNTDCTIINCYNTGTVTGRTQVGGIAGINVFGSAVTNCYNTGMVLANSYFGGIAGEVISSAITSSYHLTGTATLSVGSNPASGANMARTQRELIQLTTFVGWDFENVWAFDFDINDGYPYLRSFNMENSVERVTVDFHISLPDVPAVSTWPAVSGLETDVQLSIPWSDSYFSKSATVYNNDLAVASLVLANAAYDETRVERSLKIFGFNPDSIRKDYRVIEGDDRDRVAYAIASKKINEDTTVVAVVLRGTHDDAEWKSNLDLLARGFKSAADRVFNDELNAYLSNTDFVSTQRVQILVTGHSRGAAVGNLIGVELSSRVDPRDVFVYCFATPNSLEKKANDAVYQNIFNICNEEDLVCFVPPFFEKPGSTSWFHRENIVGMYNKFTELTSGKDLKAVMEARSRVVLPNPVTASVLQGAQWKYAHSPVTYMSFLLLEQTPISQGRVMIVSIRCPVDVEVYSTSGVLLGRVVRDVVDESITATRVFTWLNGDEKHFILPFEDEYVFNMVGTDTGVMNYVIGYADPDTWAMLVQKEFETVNLFAGKLLSSTVQTVRDVDVADVKLSVINEDGHVVAEVLEDGTEIPVQYTIIVTADTGGTVSGDGTFDANSVATLTATPDIGYSFDGWYEINIKVNGDVEYSFTVTTNRVLVARFMATSEVVLESISITSMPSKIVYVEGEVLDLSGMIVTATYSNGDTRPVTSYTTNPVDGAVLDSVGMQTVTISYTENGETKTADFTVMVNIHEHVWVIRAVVEPTCEEQGYTVYECSYCGETKEGDYTFVLGHDWKVKEVVDSACEMQGYTVYECARCSVTKDDDYVPATGHSEGEGVVTTPADCETAGVMTYYCELCGKVLRTEIISVLGHDWADGVVTIPATHETEGEMSYTCRRCGETRTEVIPKLPSDNTIIVNGVEIAFEVVNGVLTLRPMQEQMIAILAAPDKTVVFDLCGLSSSVEMYVGANWFKDVDKAIIIKTDTGETSVTTKQLWNNSGKDSVITVNNGKLSFKNA